MTIRGTILVGLLLCAALLAGIRLTPSPSRSGTCRVIEIVTGGAGFKSGYHVFPSQAVCYEWSIIGDTIVIESGAGTRAELVKSTIDAFNCALPTP
ncbi:MAG: hypothetical protein AMJ62_05285 [Myxococcales bacterium SG8_38]|nr:MAG: hypothetical protein AMJ62_05285 [Myxococcales bacterium SG8_38]